MAGAPSSPSILSSASTDWRWPRVWCLPSGLGSILRPFSRSRAARPAYSQVMDIKGSKMIRGEFTAEGRVTQHLKDVHLMLEQAERVKQRLPLLEIHADVLEACVRQGEGDLDNSAVINEIRRRMRP